MTVSFDQIPANVRTPGFYIEINNELAGATTQNFQAVMFGQRLAAGTKTQGSLDRVNNPNQARQFYGQGSMLAAQAMAYLAANPTVELWCISLDENVAGAAATGSISTTGTATAAGTINHMIGGINVQVGVAKDQTGTATAAALAAAITANNDLPITATVNAVTDTQVDLVAKWKGETGNDIPLVANYYDDQATPAGLTVADVPMSGGTANPSIAPAIASLGDEHFNWFSSAFNDSANLALLATELARRFGAMVQKGGRAFTGFRGTHAQTATFGNAQNTQHITIMGSNVVPQPPYVWAAVDMAKAASSLAIDPARPLQTLELTGLLPPKREVVWDQPERNQLLHDGISTYKVTRDGKVQIDRQITTYQENAAGLPDASYLDVNTPETLDRIRFRQRARAAQQYPRHKLAGDAMPLIPGQALVRPKDIRAMLLDEYRTMMELGWVEDFEHYAATLIVEIDINDANRANINDQPNLVNQFRIYAQKTQFIQ